MSSDLWLTVRGNLTYSRLMATGASSLGKMLILNAGEVRRLRETRPNEEHFVRPPRTFDIPAFVPEMARAPSRERYLRPTRYCNPTAPDVLAMAHQLGSGRLSDRDYAETAFHFTKEQLLLEILPFDNAEDTLRRGSGTCFHLITVFIALCRAAGIRARYKIFAMNMIEVWRESVIDADPLARKWYDALGYFMMEGEGEAFVDGRWIVAHVGPTAERQASAGLPITRFGEDAIGIWFIVRPGTIMRLESLPVGLGYGSRLLHRLAPGSMERVNLGVQRQTESGVQVLATAGGVEAYDRRVRAALGSAGPQVELTPREAIVFAD